MGDDLKQKMLGAVTWSSIDRFGQQAVQFVIGIILARLLSRADFGLIGMIMVFSALSFVLIESGFGLALVRKPDVNETDYNTIFYTNIFISAFLYLVLFFSTPLIASFFHQPQLVLIGRVVFLAILFNAFYLVPFVKLGRVMDFKTIAKVNLLATFISGFCGVVMAFLHYGVWSLVTQQVLYHFFRMILFHFFVKWKPQLIYSFNVIRSFWKFSINLLATSILNVLFNNLYVLLISRFYNVNQVGSYTQANKLSETFNFTFQSILVGSTYSLFSKIQSEDERFRRIFREIANKTSIITFPLMMVLIAVASPFIFVLLSEKWMPAVPYFQLLCLASLFSPLFALNISALNSRGQSKVTFRIEIIKKAMILLSVAISFHMGIISMLWGYAIASFVAYIVSILYVKNDLNHYIKHQITDFIGSIGIGLIMAACAFSLSFIIDNNYLLLFSQLAVSCIVYVICIRLFYNNLYNVAIQFVLSKIKPLAK
jgi:O-antigen/teichoic acid export membrane protein